MSLNMQHTRQALICTALLISTASAHWGWGNRNWDGDRDGDWDGCLPWWSSGDCSDDDEDGDNSNSNGLADPSQYGITASQLNTSNRVVIIHAVLASLVWVLLIPAGGILLRLGFKSPWVLRIHALLQVVSYLIYIAAAALGIWLVRELAYGPFSLWEDPHTRLGLAILAIAFFQPIFGYVHHKIFKRRVEDVKAGRSGKKPGRTVPGYLHLWVGRILIVLGIINGGLGLRLTARSPFSTNNRAKAIAYGVGAGIMFLVYLITVVLFEIRKAKLDKRQAQEESGGTHSMKPLPPDYNHPPSYFESQESLRKEGETTARYQ